MPQISISDAMASQIIYNTFANTGYNSSSAISTYAYNNGNQPITYTYFQLMKGTVPTDFSTIPQTGSRSSDLLVKWRMSDGAGWTSDGVHTWWFQGSDMQYATASGTATWLWWHNYDLNQAHSGSNYYLGAQAVFTVGTLGSGSDFELITTTVTAGNGYRLVNGPRLTIQTEWNY